MQETLIRTSKIDESERLKRSNGKSPISLKIEYRKDGQLWATNNGKAVAVHIQRCFPWSEPNRFYSLRDNDD